MNRVILLILDGWGIGKHDASDAIFTANTPFIDGLQATAPKATLKTFGENVGLPEGQMGNSEVGHMNIGAGRVVWQMLVRINHAFADGSIKELTSFKRLIDNAKANPSKKIHLMGLVSEGGVHSSQDHLVALCEILKEQGLDNRSYIHAFTDGRDTDPHSGAAYVSKVMEDDSIGNTQLASIIGRYYAMDRDQRWERTKKAYDLLVNGEGKVFDHHTSVFTESYNNGITDEFMEPSVLETKEGVVSINEGDIVLCFNFRTDRGRQISRVLTQEHMHEYNMHAMDIEYYTMTEYDKNYRDVQVLFKDDDLVNTLGEVLAKNGLKQLRAAETEKYPHVTFFFNGGREEPFEGEDRLLVNSPKVATYDLQPEMSAIELKDKLMEKISSDIYDFMCINFANPDMVGHTGVYSAIEKACETVDQCASELVELGKAHGYSYIIIADHGNADKAVNEDGTPNTAHTTNLVPCYVVDDKIKEVVDGKLADVAPSILQMMGVEQPDEMDGKSLV